jgi:hypothetical protein
LGALQDKDHELIQRDKALRGLSLLFDPLQLQKALRPHMDTSLLGDLKLTYVRYKPGMNCLGRFEFQVEGKTHLAYAKAFGADTAVKLAKARQARQISGSHYPGRVVMPESNLVFSFFPNDLKLGSICRLADPAMRGSLLRRVFDGSDEWEGSEQSILNYKPERRLVLRLVNAGGRVTTIKFYTGREYSSMLNQGELELGSMFELAPKKIGSSEKHCVVAFDWIAGETLQALAQDAIGANSHFYAAGQLLARYHASPVSGLSPKDKLVEVQALESLAGQLAYLLPELGVTAKKLAVDLQRVAGAMPAELCPVHGDFCDKQVIAGAQGLSMIDLDRRHLGAAIEDLGCFLAHQERRAIKDQRISKDRIASLSAEFLAGYTQAGGQCDEKNLAAWTALCLFKLSHDPFKERDADWPEQTAGMLQRTGELLLASKQH